MNKLLAGAIDETEFFTSETEVANCNNGAAGFYAKWMKEIIPQDGDGNVDWNQIQVESLTGLTVAVAQIPEVPRPFACLFTLVPRGPVAAFWLARR